MPAKRTIEKAKKAKREGKAPSTQAGEFVREEIKHIREGKHGARSAKQAIAIGLSKARRAGVPLKPPAKGRVSEKARKSAVSAYTKGQQRVPVSKTRSLAREKTLQREPRAAASSLALSRHARSVAKTKTATARSRTAIKAAQTKGPKIRSEAAKKAVRTRARAKNTQKLKV